MTNMRIAIVHYHLRPGGVTRVIQHAVSALAREGVSVVVLTGEAARRETLQLRNVRTVAGLAYDRSGRRGVPGDFIRRLEAAAAEALGGAPDLWHIHNHSLGKNACVPEAVCEFARLRRRMLLQIHDFAEDGRPRDFRRLLDGPGGGDVGTLGARLYPLAPQVHYAALNGRDLGFLADAGVPPETLHLLPNPVRMGAASGGAGPPHRPEGKPYLIYPTRAIRRKNLGEFLLWAAVCPEARFATTLAPRNPAARPVYDRWVRLAGTLGLPVEFEIAGRTSAPFPEIMRSADALVTTSVAEGFGLAFLEPWLVERPLLGRNLPEITVQFASAGVDLSDLYDRLDVPAEWIGEKALRDRIREALRKHLRSYGRELRPGDADRAFGAFVEHDSVDFGRLDESLQERVIERVSASADERKWLRPRSLGSVRDAGKRIEHNRQAVGKDFSLERYGKRLIEVYRSVLDSEVARPGALSVETLLDRFLDPARFSLLRTH